MIYCIGGTKGGSGKTTIATNLAVYFSLIGKETLLVDGDSQRSSVKWGMARESVGKKSSITVIHLSESAILSEVSKLSRNYDEIIIDVGGRDNASLRYAMLASDIFLSPFRPRNFDIWTLNELEMILKEALIMNPKLRTYGVINQADPRGSDNKESMDVLKDSDLLKPIGSYICQRKSFANSSAEGLGILECSPVDKKAKEELEAVIRAISLS